VLLDDLIPKAPMLEALREALLQLTVYAVAFRYPGESASRENARAARALCESVRKLLRQHLGIRDACGSQR
jgi:hypothetical protein